jgi:aryl-alcohol dehydrogenase-like predicted oxidoreductase
MNELTRRRFMEVLGAAGVGAAVERVLAGQTPASARSEDAASQPATTRPAASDTVALGRTGVRPSRLAIGTGTRSGTEQRAVGMDGFVRVLRHGHDQGVRWWDGADMYQTHPHLRAALKDLHRDEVVITSKTQAKTAEGVKADIERFRRELDTDYIDIVLLHCMTDGQWPKKLRGAMDALSEAKARGHVRAVGCSCHTFEALQAAAAEPWVEVDLARINPFGRIMDVEKAEEVPRVVEVLADMHRRGKAVYGMKILAEGAFKGDQIDRSLRFALAQPYLSGFTIGFSKTEQIDDIMRRIERAGRA